MQPFRFFDIPRELQDKIVEHVAISSEPIWVTPPMRSHSFRNPWTGSEQTQYRWATILHRRSECYPPALARTCRRFRSEILPLYYKHNTFNSVFDKKYLPRWLRRLEPQYRCVVRLIVPFEPVHMLHGQVFKILARQVIDERLCRMGFKSSTTVLSRDGPNRLYLVKLLE